MSSFLDPLRIEAVEGSDRQFKILEPFRYWIDELHKGPVITVTEGFITDFASVPRILWAIFPPYGRYGKSAVVHDWLYKTGMYDKKRCDEIFLEAMEVRGVSWITRNTLYYAVRVFGFIAWNKHRKADLANPLKSITLTRQFTVKDERY